MKGNNYKPHELALLFPSLGQTDAAELAVDIKLNGLREAITTFEGQILDGVQRYGACRDAEVRPRFIAYESSEPFNQGQHPVDFVMSKNFHRRHIPAGQKGAIKVAAEKLREKKYSTFTEIVDRGHEAFKERKRQRDKRATEVVSNVEKTASGRPKLMAKTLKQMASEAGVGLSTISLAQRLAKESPRKFEAVKAGRVALHDAVKSLPPTERQQENAEERAKKLRAGLTLEDSIGKLRKKAMDNGGQIYVELGGYGFRCFQLCKGK
jgi:hypothetical protein